MNTNKAPDQMKTRKKLRVAKKKQIPDNAMVISHES